MQLATLVFHLCVVTILTPITTAGQDLKLEVQPRPQDSSSNLIWIKTYNSTNVKYWHDQLDKFLADYTKNRISDNVMLCDANGPAEGKVCDFRVDDIWIPCHSSRHYGFNHDQATPCIFLRMNKILNWNPQPYNSTNLPKQMPEYLKTQILENEKRGENKMIFVDCVGKYPADIENTGPLIYYPQRGFHQKYFPFKNIEDYLSPLVAVHFENPHYGVVIGIECKLWARNIQHDNGEGSVHFELLID